MSQDHVEEKGGNEGHAVGRGDELAGHLGGPVRSLMLSAVDVALLLSVSTRTIWRLDASGRLPRAIQIGGCKRWRQEELIAWILAGCPVRSDWQWGTSPSTRSVPRFVKGGK